MSSEAGSTERCTIIVVPRDRFSSTTRCLETLLANTPESHELIVVMGGAPEHLRAEWTRRFEGRAQFMFEPEFVSPPQARNIGLRAATTRLAVLMDNDVYVRTGWLSPLIRCQQETGGVMVVPIILEKPNKLHTAGNDFYISYERGKAYGHKTLRFRGMALGERCNLKRQPTDYGELHCQLVVVKPTLALNAYDERLMELGEVDSGLAWAKGGHTMWCEPSSVAYFAFAGPLTFDDVRFFIWRWEAKSILEGQRIFEEKWGVDLTERGTFADWLTRYSTQVGLLPRVFPVPLSLTVDRRIGQLRRLAVEPFRQPKRLYRRWRAKTLGYDVMKDAMRSN